MVNGFVTTGSSIFTLAMPHILEGLLSHFEETCAGCGVIECTPYKSTTWVKCNFDSMGLRINGYQRLRKESSSGGAKY